MAPLDFRVRPRPRAGLLLTAHTLVAVANGRSRRRAFRELPEGLLVPHPVARNIRSPRDLARLASEALEEVGVSGGARLALALPDLALSTRVDRDEKRRSRRELERRLESATPYPTSEARWDFFRGARGGVLSVAVRKGVVEQYEQLVEALDCELGWVDGISLARIPEWSTALGDTTGLHVRVQVYRSHYSAAVYRDGALTDLRFKLRASSELAPVERELSRLPALYGAPTLTTLEFLGADAETLAASAGGSPRREESSEAEHAEQTLRILLERGSP